MRACTRGAEPPQLENAAEWTAAWQRRAPEGGQFAWPTVDGTRLNQHLLPHLRAMTQEHCAYCDNYLDEGLAESIDHFKPKAAGLFPELAFTWNNLFPACATCQKQKLDQFSARLLKPDEPTYSFDRYFVFRVRSGFIEPRPGLRAADRARAEETIRILGLNENGLPIARRRELEKESTSLSVDEWPFRFTRA